MAPPRVLLIDDEEAARYGMRRGLSNQGYEIEEASDGVEALRRAGSFRPDVVVSDLNMPGMDGLTLLRRLNLDDPEAPLLVLITAYGSEEVAIEALRGGAYDYLTKPYDVEQLRAVVRRAAEKRRLRLENRDYLQRLEQALHDLRESQTELVQTHKIASLGRLVAGISHEINTPLGVIQSSVDLIDRAARKAASNASETGLRETLLAVTAPCLEACYRINTIVASLRQFSQLDRAEIQSVGIAACLDHTLLLLRSELGDAIRVERDDAGLPGIEANPRQLNQVFMNLLLNSIEAIRAAGRPGLIRITVRASDRLRVTIEDNGCGIPPENEGRIFDPGFTTKGQGVGTGLGLPAAYQMVRQHQGSIEVSSHPGQGTTVTVTLPLRAG